MKYIILFFIIWFISQTIKFFIRILSGRDKFSWKVTYWIYAYGDGAPSTHSALLVSFLYILGAQRGMDEVWGFALCVSLVLMYNLVAEREKENISELYAKASSDISLRKLVADGVMHDISGHTYGEVIVGVILGLILGALIISMGGI